MNLANYLELGEEALPAAEAVFTEGAALVSKIVTEAKPLAEQLITEAKDAWAEVTNSKIAGTEKGAVVAAFVDDITRAYASAKELIGGDVTTLSVLASAAEAQLKALAAQVAAGKDVTSA